MGSRWWSAPLRSRCFAAPRKHRELWIVEWIVSEKTQFLMWIQASVNALMWDTAATTLRVRLAPRHLRSHWEVHADLRAVSSDLGPDGEIFVAIVMFAERLVPKNRVRPLSYGLGTKRDMEFRSLDTPSGKRLRL